MTAHQNAALQAILAGLNAQGQDNIPTANYASTSVIPGLGSLQPETTPNPSVVSLPKPRTPVPTAPSTPPIPDASNITTYPAALKHITKYIATNEVLGAKIRTLIAEQHKHEQQWWAGREAIVMKQLSRVEAQQQAAALLRSLGGVAGAVKEADVGADRAELDVYDRKVYAELMKMTVDFDRRLRAIGVPFYAIKHELVVMEGVDGKGRIDRGELRQLQGRVVQLLEDLFLE